MVKEQKGKKEKTLEESLKDPVYVNYNILLKLEEIKKILFSCHEMWRYLIQKILKEEQPKKKRKKGKAGVFR